LDTTENVDETSLKKVKILKYKDSYIEYGFTYLNKNGKDVPQCVICGMTLANASLKPNKLISHMETSHAQYKNNTRDFFLRKFKELKKNKKNDKYLYGRRICLKCSYLTALHIAKSKKPYLIGEKLLKPCMTDICTELFSNKHKNTYV